jgi:hypothetical protein
MVYFILSITSSCPCCCKCYCTTFLCSQVLESCSRCYISTSYWLSIYSCITSTSSSHNPSCKVISWLCWIINSSCFIICEWYFSCSSSSTISTIFIVYYNCIFISYTTSSIYIMVSWITFPNSFI